MQSERKITLEKVLTTLNKLTLTTLNFLAVNQKYKCYSVIQQNDFTLFFHRLRFSTFQTMSNKDQTGFQWANKNVKSWLFRNEHWWTKARGILTTSYLWLQIHRETWLKIIVPLADKITATLEKRKFNRGWYCQWSYYYIKFCCWCRFITKKEKKLGIYLITSWKQKHF